MTNEMHEALKRAIKKAGGTNAMARACDVAPPSVSQWNIAPPLRVLQIERASGVSRQELRPDLYPPEERKAS